MIHKSFADEVLEKVDKSRRTKKETNQTMWWQELGHSMAILELAEKLTLGNIKFGLEKFGKDDNRFAVYEQLYAQAKGWA